MRGKGAYPYPCPGCGETVNATAAYRARQRLLCRACCRVRNGWACPSCGSNDPHHAFPCSGAVVNAEVPAIDPHDTAEQSAPAVSTDLECPVCGPGHVLIRSGEGWFCAGVDACTVYFTFADLQLEDSPRKDVRS